MRVRTEADLACAVVGFPPSPGVAYERIMSSWHLRVAGLSLAFYNILFLLFVEALGRIGHLLR